MTTGKGIAVAACPSCAAPLDTDGICTACGALSRGYFRGLDLGPPQVAAAVARGLDFYQLLDVPHDAEIRLVARRYRRLRALFPDDPRRLAAEPARKLELLELAGRVLSDPALRRTYDQLRSGGPTRPDLAVVRCSACSAPLEPGADRCRFCGTMRPAEPKSSAGVADDGPPAGDPTDFYALLGLTAEHLYPPPPPPRPALGWGRADLRVEDVYSIDRTPRPPTEAEIDAAAGRRQQDLLMAAGIAPEEREARFERIEIARRVLRDERRRPQYDALLMALAKGQVDRMRLEALHALEESVLAEIREDAGQPGGSDVRAALRQARGYLDAGVPREALPVLRRAIAGHSADPELHQVFVQAVLASDDPLVLGGQLLRQTLASLEAADRAGRPIDNGPALVGLCRGLIAREEGRVAAAEQALQEATRLDRGLGAAWRALAALALASGNYDGALAYARHAVAADRADERALLLVAAACLRARRRDPAREAADQIARLRGAGWNAERVLREIDGA